VEVVIDPAIDNLGGSTTLTKTGAGRAILSGANTYTGLTTVEAGTLQLDGDSNDIIVGGPNIADPGGADLRGGKIVFDYAGTTSPLNEVLQALVAGRSSNYADFVPGLIRLKSTTATSSRGLGYIDDTTGSLLTVASTLYGDADLDFTVGFADLLAVAQSYNAPGVWSNGDFDYDGTVGFTDLLALAQNYGTTAMTDGTIRLDADVASNFQSDWALARSLVPEPAVVTTLVGTACLLIRRRRAA
jgi:autotransporter-associated beta strand protein